MARIDLPQRRGPRPRPTKAEYEEFYESMAATGPRAYHREVAVDERTVPEQIVRVVASVLNLLLAVRFIVALFTSDTANSLVALVYNLTNWLVLPLQAWLGTPPSGGGGYFDLPALAAIVIVSLVAWAINLAIRSLSEERPV